MFENSYDMDKYILIIFFSFKLLYEINRKLLKPKIFGTYKSF